MASCVCGTWHEIIQNGRAQVRLSGLIVLSQPVQIERMLNRVIQRTSEQVPSFDDGHTSIDAHNLEIPNLNQEGFQWKQPMTHSTPMALARTV